jgi:uncharacterized protein YyaL (SSP411 family)
MMTGDRLLHSWRAGDAKTPATSSDYAAMISAALTLAAVTGDPARIGEAAKWVEVLDRYYWDDDLAGYTLSASDTTDVIVRPFSGHDDATPNANGMMVSNLVALWMLTGDDTLRARAETIISGFTGEIAKNMFAHTSLLSGAMDLVSPTHIVISAPDGKASADKLLAAARLAPIPGVTIQVIESIDELSDSSPLKDKTSKSGKATAYVCVGPVCAPPVTTAKALEETLRERRAVKP